MRREMNRKTDGTGKTEQRYVKRGLCLAAAAFVLAAGPKVGEAMAYFTTYAGAEGSAAVSLEPSRVDVEETVSDMTKRITIKNTGPYDCRIRVKVLAGEAYQAQLKYVDSQGKWTTEPDADGYLYYNETVKVGESAVPLDAVIGIKDQMGSLTGGLAFEAAQDGLKAFDVIVAAECTPVFYDSQGNAQYSWEAAEPILGEGGF